MIFRGATYKSYARTKKYFLNRPFPAYFSFVLSVQTNITIFTTNLCEKCPSSKQHWDSNPQPSAHETPHLTTEPGLNISIFFSDIILQ